MQIDFEGSFLFEDTPDQIDARPTSVGRGMPNEEVFLVDESGHRVGPGGIGELVVRGSNVMKGYWRLPDESEQVLKPGPLPGEKALFTGDLRARRREELRAVSSSRIILPQARRSHDQEKTNANNRISI